MSVHQKFANTLDRIAAVTSIIRTRQEDTVRETVNGGTNESYDSRVSEAISRLERVAARLEKAV